MLCLVLMMRSFTPIGRGEGQYFEGTFVDHDLIVTEVGMVYCANETAQEARV